MIQNSTWASRVIKLRKRCEDDPDLYQYWYMWFRAYSVAVNLHILKRDLERICKLIMEGDY